MLPCLKQKRSCFYLFKCNLVSFFLFNKKLVDFSCQLKYSYSSNNIQFNFQQFTAKYLFYVQIQFPVLFFNQSLLNCYYSSI